MSFSPIVSLLISQCFVEREKILKESTGELATEIYTLNVLPPIVFRNLLQMPVTVSLEVGSSSYLFIILSLQH